MTAKQDERPWYVAVTVSAAVHLCLIAVVSRCAWGVSRSQSPRIDLEAGWMADATSAAESTDVSMSAMEIAPAAAPPEATVQLPTAGIPEVSRKTGDAQPGSGLSIRLKVDQPLTSRWLSDARSSNGLSDIVGPMLYTADGIGRPAQAGNPKGHGKGSGSSAEGRGDFFGILNGGQRIVYVVDASKSMNRPCDGEAKTRFGQLKIELARSILSLKQEQQFFIVFFNEHPNPMPAAGPENAIPSLQQKYLTWMAGVQADGLTDPRPALAMALALNPDVVYLLTDGSFPRESHGDLSSLRQSSARIHTIAFGDIRAERLLKTMAANNGGTFAFIP